MGMILPIAPMGVKHGDGTTPEHLAAHGAIESIQAWRPTAHERAQYARGVLVKSGAEHGRHRQDNVPIDDALMEHPAHWAHPVVDVHLGAAPAQGGFATHRHPMRALATVLAAVLDIAHLCWVAPG